MDAVEQYETDADLESSEGTDPAAPPLEAESPVQEDRESEGSEVQPADPGTAQAMPLDLAAALESLQTEMARGFTDVQRAFEDKLAYDGAKERQIDRLHAELQEHKQDLVARIKRPLTQGIVRLHDDLGKVVAALHRRPAEDLTPERFFRAFAGFTDDVELLLGQHGIETFLAPGDTFDPRRQTALRTEATDDPDLAGTIAVRLRPGFVEGEAMLQKERVAVYAAVARSPSPPASSLPAPTASAPAADTAVDPSADPTEQKEPFD